MKHCTTLVAASLLALCGNGAANPAEQFAAGAGNQSVAAPNRYPFESQTIGKALLNTLVLQAPRGPEFHKSAFEYPIVGPDGCTTRERVIIDGASEHTLASPCTVLYPQWVSVWDANVLVDPADVDVAHMVPLEEAWYSGAWAWTAKQRRDFANDLTNSYSLRVLTESTNAERGSSDPAHWWPTIDGYRCNYAAEWVWVKARWNLSVDPAEFEALMTELDETEDNYCRDKPVYVPPLGLNPGRGPASIIGGIFTPSGTPYSHIGVQAYDAHHALVRETRVRVEGSYELTGLPPGSYTVKFLGGTSGTSDQWYSEVPGGPPEVITLKAGSIASGITVAMVAAPGPASSAPPVPGSMPG
ncbi:GmrSD restriction endonuclease domain-containing protein [Arthrobacter globiformis]|uniref:GmrSD restriction endonuclease domain-containing protein n=1 Tax=Arthrobacter globiformis TaxID=1665 RepID=UPI00167D8A2E|nr:DUF1524 domain-containing protein [Arthrobacter globiformis]